MGFFFTPYIELLENKIALSNNLKIYLDNPRTEEEIDLIEKELRRQDYESYDWTFSLEPFWWDQCNTEEELKKQYPNSWQYEISKETDLQQFIRRYKEASNSKIIKNFFQNNAGERDCVRTLIKMLVIIKFPEDDKENVTNFCHTLEYLNSNQDEELFINRYLISDWSIDKVEGHEFAIIFHHYLSGIHYYGTSKNDKEKFKKEIENLKVNQNIKNILLWSERFDKFFYKYEGEKEKDGILYVLHIISSLYITSSLDEVSYDDRLLKLIPIIEHLLMLKPNKSTNDQFTSEVLKILDSEKSISKKNLRDLYNNLMLKPNKSITDQFTSKVLKILDSENKKSISKKSLRDLYYNRSNLAHGRFLKYKNSTLNHTSLAEIIMEDILKRYLEDSSFIKNL